MDTPLVRTRLVRDAHSSWLLGETLGGGAGRRPFLITSLFARKSRHNPPGFPASTPLPIPHSRHHPLTSDFRLPVLPLG